MGIPAIVDCGMRAAISKKEPCVNCVRLNRKRACAKIEHAVYHPHGSACDRPGIYVMAGERA
jgi:hypothetical protein